MREWADSSHYEKLKAHLLLFSFVLKMILFLVWKKKKKKEYLKNAVVIFFQIVFGYIFKDIDLGIRKSWIAFEYVFENIYQNSITLKMKRKWGEKKKLLTNFHFFQKSIPKIFHFIFVFIFKTYAKQTLVRKLFHFRSSDNGKRFQTWPRWCLAGG